MADDLKYKTDYLSLAVHYQEILHLTCPYK